MQNPAYPLISILTPNYNTEIEIIEFLDSLINQDYPLHLIEVLVIDNGSTDQSVKKINLWFVNNPLFYRTQLISVEKNMGIAYAYNVAYENVSSESKILIRTESDIELDSKCISTLVNTLMSINKCGLAGAKGIFFHDKKTLNHAARYINWWSGKMSEFEPSEVVDCDCVFGGTFAVRKDLIQKMGYFFRPDRFLANEIEFCTRVKLEDMRVVCQPLAISYHKGGNTTKKISKNKFSFIDTREVTLFHLYYNKHLKKITTLALFLLSTLKRLLSFNFYPLRGFVSAVVSYILKANVLLPVNIKSKLSSEWLLE